MKDNIRNSKASSALFNQTCNSNPFWSSNQPNFLKHNHHTNNIKHHKTNLLATKIKAIDPQT